MVKTGLNRIINYSKLFDKCNPQRAIKVCCPVPLPFTYCSDTSKIFFQFLKIFCLFSPFKWLTKEVIWVDSDYNFPFSATYFLEVTKGSPLILNNWRRLHLIQPHALNRSSSLKVFVFTFVYFCCLKI